MLLHTDVDGTDYHYTGLDQTLPLASAWRKFSLVFAANDTQGSKGRLIFTLGKQAGGWTSPTSPFSRARSLPRSCRAYPNP